MLDKLIGPTDANDRVHWRNSRYSGSDTQNSSTPGYVVVIFMTCSGLGYASGRRITAFSTEKIAVFAPMPRASVMTAITVTSGCFTRIRSQ